MQRTRPKSNKTTAKSTDLIDIPSLITVWFLVRVQAGPPVNQWPNRCCLIALMNHRTRNALLCRSLPQPMSLRALPSISKESWLALLASGSGCYSSPPEGFLDFQSDVAPGQPDIMQVAVGPSRQFAALPNPVAPNAQGVADLLHKIPATMICHRIMRGSGHFWPI